MDQSAPNNTPNPENAMQQAVLVLKWHTDFSQTCEAGGYSICVAELENFSEINS